MISLTDLELLIDHELESGWFLLGVLICRQHAGLPMGSPWGGALTRLVLIYCDIVFYRSLHAWPIGAPSQRGRISRCKVFGVAILVLEARCGTVSTRPAIQHCPQYREISHSNFMHFSSFVSRSIKRAVILGMISRISTYTFPDSDKPPALLEAIEMLSKVCGFPVSFLRRCAQERMQSEPWIFDVRWSTLE